MRKGQGRREILSPEQIERIPNLVKQYIDNGYGNWADLIGLRFGVAGETIRTHYRKWKEKQG